MEDFEIEIIESDNKEKTNSMQLPLNFLTIGEVENDDLKVYIKQDVYKELEKYASSDTSKELGTIILGDYTEELGKMHVIISDFIFAKYTDASASTLTFTHDTWDYIHKEHDSKYSDKKIVGWQHTHPGYGIFLSNYDMFIQENFFNVPFQVAYVIDPVQHLRGFFQWKNGKVEKLKGFYIYDDIGNQIRIDQPKPYKTEKKEDDKTVEIGLRKYQPFVIGIMAILILGLLFSVFSLSNKYSVQLKNQKSMENQIEGQNALIAQQADELAQIKETVKNQSKDAENVVNENNHEKSGEMDGVSETKVSSNDSETMHDNEVVFQSYIVKRGDSLVSICGAHGLSYESTYRIIMSMNGIEDANQIYEGQTILLPITD